MSDELVTLQVQGASTGEMTRGDWSEFHINIGKQYPVKLATKKEEIKQQARAAGTQQAVWTYNEKDGNPNPNRPGTFYKNRYLESVVVGGTLDPNLVQQPSSSTPGSPPASQDDRSRSIERQVVVKAAMHLYPPAAVANAEDFWKLLDEVADWIGASPKGQDAAAGGQPNDDDDIPFLWVDAYGKEPAWSVRWREC